MVKPCCNCQRVLPLSMFHKDNTRATGLASCCRHCLKERRKARGTARRPKPYVAQNEREPEQVARQLAALASEWSCAQPNARFGVPMIGAAA